MFVGGTTFMIQLVLLFILHGKEDIKLPIATSIAYWASIVYNFCMNRWWTFSATENKNLHKHLVAYGSLLLFNYLFTVIFIHFASRGINYAFANALAVPFQMLWNYYMYKNVIFKKNTPSTDPNT